MRHRRIVPALACALAAALLPTGAAHAKPAPAPKAKPYCVTHKCIALTFDDGPSANTTKLLATLKKYNAKATFFLMGSHVKAHPVLTKNIFKAGHQIGNHTWSHPWLTEVSTTKVYKEINDTQKLIKKITGKSPKLLRAPGGLTDEYVIQVAAKLGLILVPGTVATKDYITSMRDTGLLVDAALEVAGRGEVVLMHEPIAQTVASMPHVLKALKAQGYSFVTVSKLLEGTKLVPGQVYPEPSGDLDEEEDMFDGPAGEV